MKNDKKKYDVSIIIPCHNEEENIENCIKRIPNLNLKTEIVVVDDGSKDNTAEVVRKLQKRYKNLKLISYNTNKGKGPAVNTGMTKAMGEILIILDADMAVRPEDIPKFINPLLTNKNIFVNGTRFQRKMEKGAMKKFNLIGNKLMGYMFSKAISQKITDSLCGTKALYKNDFNKMGGISKDDPWSDFSLIFGAARLNLRIIEIPISYRKRIAGKSKMKLLKHSFQLFRVWFKQYSIFRSASATC